MDIRIKFYSYSRIGTNENNMKIRMCGLCVDRKARNHCQDVDNCGDPKTTVSTTLETAVRIESTVRNGNEHADR